MIRLSLPWMPSALRPNGNKGSWRKKHTATQLYRSVCDVECREQGLGKLDPDIRPHLTLTFHQPTNARADLDNHLAAAKALVDSISNIIGIDDYHFSFEIHRGTTIKGGRVIVTVTER